MTSDNEAAAKRRGTKIEWTEFTWNPTVGCSIASAGCTNCYAMRQAHRIESFGTAPAYQGLTKSTKGGPVWTGKVGRASAKSLRKPLGIAEPAVIFVNSMSDLFEPNMQDEWQTDAFDVMRRADRHTYQILTKRPDVAAAYYDRHPEVRNLPHVWLGVSVERADVRWRIDRLREIPAAVRFLSIEPLIGSVGELNLTGIHWVITGGESGPDARRCDPTWVREVRDQCDAAGVPLFHKQWGKWANNPLISEEHVHEERAMRIDQDPKAKGGASLDGRLHRDLPAIAGPLLAP